jgi:hypothetical protein
VQESTFNVTFRPGSPQRAGDSTAARRGWFAWLLDPEPPRVEPYAVTVQLSGSQPRRHADRDLLRTAFRTAAAHGGPVEVSCSGEISDRVAGHRDI